MELDVSVGDCNRGAPRELGTGPEAALPTCTTATVAVAVAAAVAVASFAAAVGGFLRPCPSVPSVPPSATPTTATPAPCPDSARAYFHAYFHDDHCPRGQVAPHIVPPSQEHRRDPERRVAQSHPPPEIALKSCIGRHTLNLLGIISSRFPFPFPFHIYFPARAPDLTARPPACLVRSLLGYFWDWITWGLVLCIMCMFPPTTTTTAGVQSVICSAGTASALRVLHFFLLDRFRRHSRRLPFCARLLPSVSQRYCRVAIRSSFPFCPCIRLFKA